MIEPQQSHPRRMVATRGAVMKRLVVIVVLLLLAACSHPPQHGTVYNKQYDPSYQWLQGMCASYNQNGSCAVTVYISQIEPPHWFLCLENHDNGKDNKGCREVDEITFHQYEVGNTYPRS